MRNSSYRYLYILLLLLYPVISRADERDSTRLRTKNKINLAIYPAIGYKPETSFLFGVVGVAVFNQENYSDRRYYRPATITPYFFYTLKNQFLSYVNLEMFPGDKYYISGKFRYWNYPDLYFGVGNNTSGVNEEYTNRILRYEGKFAKIFRKDIMVGLAVLWQNNRISNIRNNGFLDTAGVIGKNGGNTFGFGPQFRFDNRNNTLYTTRGFYLETYFIFNPGGKLDDYDFNLFALDFRAFTHALSEKNILAFQAYYTATWGKNIPFYLLPKLGGDQRLRGIEHENRYSDRQAYYAQVEGRRHLFWRFGGVLFAGLGDVNRSLHDFSYHNLKFVYGIGGRFQPLRDEPLNIRIDAGKGPGREYAIYFSLNEAF